MVFRHAKTVGTRYERIDVGVGYLSVLSVVDVWIVLQVDIVRLKMFKVVITVILVEC